MQSRCPSAQFVKVGCLPGYKLGFPRKSRRRGCGVAGIQKCPDEEVWGVIYRLLAEDLRHLDTFEDYGGPNHKDNGYERVTHPVKGRSGKIYEEVHLYVALPDNGQVPLPSPDYLKQILAGARFWNLPELYLEKLEKHEGRARD